MGPDRPPGANASLAAILVWHYHAQARVYRDVVVQVSNDKDFVTGVTTVFNNDHDNTNGLGLGRDKEYIETNEGKLFDAQGNQGPLRPAHQQRQHLERHEPLRRSGGLRRAGQMSKAAFRALVPLVVLGALLFRLPGLSLRPMHHDEANQAMKFGALLEAGEYRYDPADHHGPSLYYLTWVLAKALGRTTAGFPRRGGPPAAAGPLRRGDRRPAAPVRGRSRAGRPPWPPARWPPCRPPSRITAGSTSRRRSSSSSSPPSSSPFGNTGSARRALGRRRPAAAAGLMFATKETSVIVFAAVGAAILLTRSLAKARAGGARRRVASPACSATSPSASARRP